MDDEPTKLTIRMSAALHRRVKIAAITENTSLQDFVIEALEKKLAELGQV
ncbi:toxin-antitoxin system HicB family antitoxin [Segniliparus rugosus]|nr:toxin-antitoxin system HicB family antitoxin [Segniliparus rugosus]